MPKSEEFPMRYVFHDDVQIPLGLPIVKDLNDEWMMAETIMDGHLILALAGAINVRAD